jgi:hypothetical protein
VQLSLTNLYLADYWFTSNDNRYPEKSFDFGADGYTASINLGHELLQLTAPDDKCGLVYVRGSFSDYPDAILARAQRRQGGKSTFGLKISTDVGPYELESRQPGEQGFLNFRCPYVDYPLKSKDSEDGRCVAFSFVRNKVVFQILRIEVGALIPTKAAEVNGPDGNLKVGGIAEPSARRPSATVWGKEGPQGATVSEPSEERKVKIRVGGKLRIGCSCQFSPQTSTYLVESHDSILSCINTRYDKKLDIQMFINGKKNPIQTERKETEDATEVDAVFDHDIVLHPNKVMLVVATFALRDRQSTDTISELPPSAEFARDLGVGKSSANTTDLLWLDRIDLRADSSTDDDFYDLCTSASCLEQILNVASVPMRMVSTAEEKQSSKSSTRAPSIAQGKEQADTAEEPGLPTEGNEPARPGPPQNLNEPAAMASQDRQTKEGGEEFNVEKNSSGATSPEARVQIIQRTTEDLNSDQETGKDSSTQHQTTHAQSSAANGEQATDSYYTSDRSAPALPFGPDGVDLAKGEAVPTLSSSSQGLQESTQLPSILQTSENQTSASQLNGKSAGSQDSEDPGWGIALLTGIVGKQQVDLQRAL